MVIELTSKSLINIKVECRKVLEGNIIRKYFIESFLFSLRENLDVRNYDYILVSVFLHAFQGILLFIPVDKLPFMLICQSHVIYDVNHWMELVGIIFFTDLLPVIPPPFIHSCFLGNIESLSKIVFYQNDLK